jgi:hypothetical protein
LPLQRSVIKDQAQNLGPRLFRLLFDLSAESSDMYWAQYDHIDVLLQHVDAAKFPGAPNGDGPPMTTLVVGGGIGRLTAALSLYQIGVDWLVFESVSVPRPLGVGINVLPHAVRELTELGLEGALAETGIPTAELAYYNKHGQRIWSELHGGEAGYNWPQFLIHRGPLQLVLL